MCLSELNASGGLRGGKPKYGATLGLTIDKIDPEEEGEDICRIRVVKHRDGAEGDQGLFVRDWRTTHFYP